MGALIDATINAIKTTHDVVGRALENIPDQALQPFVPGRDSPRWIDAAARVTLEPEIAIALKKTGRPAIFVYDGDQRDPGFDVTEDGKTTVLVTLMEGNFAGWRLNHWSSSLVFFQRGRILAALIAVPNETAFFATDDRPGVYQWSLVHPQDPPSEAHVGRHHSITTDTIMRLPFGSTQPGTICVMPDFYVEPHAGPLMCTRLFDNQRRALAVFDPRPVAPCEFVAGAWLCLKAGGVALDRGGEPLTQDQLLSCLTTPFSLHSRRAYVLAPRSEHAKAILAKLSTEAEQGQIH